MEDWITMIFVFVNFVVFASLTAVAIGMIALWRSNRCTDTFSWITFAYCAALVTVGSTHFMMAVSPWWQNDELNLVLNVAAALASAVAVVVSPVAIRLLKVTAQAEQTRVTNIVLARHICQQEETLRELTDSKQVGGKS